VWQKLFLLAIAVLFMGLVAHRIWRAEHLLTTKADPPMPSRTGDAEEQALHAVPGGKYTRADIELNGKIPSRKYRGYRARHDYDPVRGDRLCPVTRTKANLDCTWHIDGQLYMFCCPPCIDEFVRLAKEHPDRVLPPDYYVK
jgi:hypothetical protein